MTPDIFSCTYTDFKYFILVVRLHNPAFMQQVKEPTQGKKGKEVNVILHPLTQCLHCQVISKQQEDLEPTPDTAWHQLYGNQWSTN